MVATVSKKETLHELITLDTTGDHKMTWDPNNVDEVAAARKSFDDLLKKRFTAFEADSEGDRAGRVTTFDPDAKKLILVPPLKGG